MSVKYSGRTQGKLIPLPQIFYQGPITTTESTPLHNIGKYDIYDDQRVFFSFSFLSRIIHLTLPHSTFFIIVDQIASNQLSNYFLVIERKPQIIKIIESKTFSVRQVFTYPLTRVGTRWHTRCQVILSSLNLIRLCGSVFSEL